MNILGINSIAILFILTFIVTVVATYFIRNVLLDAAISDSPIVSEHRHKIGTPTMGGISFLFAILFIISLYYNNTILLLTSLIMISGGIMGLLDDLLGLKVKEHQQVVKNRTANVITLGILDLGPGEEARVTTDKAKKEVKPLLEAGKLEEMAVIPIKYEPSESVKIIAQILPGLFLAIMGVVLTLGGFNLGYFLAFPIVIIAVLGCINTINLIDGMDGLAAGIVAIASFSSMIFCYLNGNLMNMAPFALLLRICLGFLVFNKYPAKIFMGDTGSFILGTGYAAAVLITNIPYFGLLSLAVPIGSTIISLLHRAHVITLPVEPLHHTLHYHGMSEIKIVISYWLITAIACILGLLVQYFFFI